MSAALSKRVRVLEARLSDLEKVLNIQTDTLNKLYSIAQKLEDKKKDKVKNTTTLSLRNSRAKQDSSKTN